MLAALLPLFLIGLGSTITPLFALQADHDHHGHDHDHGDHARVTHGFGDVEKWASVWDDPERDEWQQPEQVIEAMEIEPGMTVVDLGAGTGYFNATLSVAVGPGGRVYPIDVEPTLVEYMIERAKREDTPNVHPVLGEYDDPKIPGGSVDRILIVNTYHHIDERRAYFVSVRSPHVDLVVAS